MKYEHTLNIPQMEISLSALQDLTALMTELQMAIQPTIKTIKNELLTGFNRQCQFKLVAVCKVWNFDEEKSYRLEEFISKHSASHKVHQHFDMYSCNGYIKISNDDYCIDIYTNCQ